ncbi:hypothetical protein IQ07DRAFT_397834 [Pyrenochaeta sp. DS3sAY3a]|nr:hypothetical protein IQ07DRAFT_397834 [Pyrenochaeta sp. DS3sAY3a]
MGGSDLPKELDDTKVRGLELWGMATVRYIRIWDRRLTFHTLLVLFLLFGISRYLVGCVASCLHGIPSSSCHIHLFSTSNNVDVWSMN